jgi:hypothetical protein
MLLGKLGQDLKVLYEWVHMWQFFNFLMKVGGDNEF